VNYCPGEAGLKPLQMPGISPPGQVHATRLFGVGIIGFRRPWSTVSYMSTDGVALVISIPEGHRFYNYYTTALSKLLFDVNTRKVIDVCFSRTKNYPVEVKYPFFARGSV
jgi:hypothetical protein